MADPASVTFEEHRRRVLSALPEALASLSGSASVEGLSANDLDLVVLVNDVPSAATSLRDLYPPLYEEEWRDDWAAFRAPGSPQVDIVITRPRTKGDAHHRRAWELLAADDGLRAEYRSLKTKPNDYEQRKAAFFERVVRLLGDP